LLSFEKTAMNTIRSVGIIASLGFLLLGFASPGWSIDITVCHTNDMHGGIDETGAVYMNPDFPPPLGGGASAKDVIDYFREQAKDRGEGFLLLDAGDFFQGTPVGTRTQGTAIMDFMNRMDYDAATIGNHEFDIGKDALIALIKQSNFPFLVCNLFDTRTGELVDFAQPYLIKDIAGVKVGLVGAVLHSTPEMAFPENIKGLEFGPEVPALTKWAQIARSKGAELVFAIVHTGLPYDREEGWKDLQKRADRGFKNGYATNAMELAHRVPDVDIFFCGHIHVGYDQPWEDPVTHALCFQTWGRGSGIGVVTLKIDGSTHTLSGYKLYGDGSEILTLFSEEFPRNPEEATAIDTVVARVEAGMDQPIGSSLEPLTRTGAQESLMGNLVADAMRQELNGDFAFTNKGGVRAEIAAGPITPRDVFAVIPFDNQLVALNLTGKFLSELIESKLQRPGSGMYISGARIVVDPAAPQGERLVSFYIGGKPVDPDQVYKIVTTDYLLQGNSGMQLLTSVPESSTTYTGVLMRNAVEDYITRNSPLSPQLDGRWSEAKKEGT
jgi:5'-nucleotidase/UDP-sugar diphosphatase